MFGQSIVSKANIDITDNPSQDPLQTTVKPLILALQNKNIDTLCQLIPSLEALRAKLLILDNICHNRLKELATLLNELGSPIDISRKNTHQVYENMRNFILKKIIDHAENFSSLFRDDNLMLFMMQFKIHSGSALTATLSSTNLDFVKQAIPCLEALKNLIQIIPKVEERRKAIQALEDNKVVVDHFIARPEDMSYLKECLIQPIVTEEDFEGITRLTELRNIQLPTARRRL